MTFAFDIWGLQCLHAAKNSLHDPLYRGVRIYRRPVDYHAAAEGLETASDAVTEDGRNG